MANHNPTIHDEDVRANQTAQVRVPRSWPTHAGHNVTAYDPDFDFYPEDEEPEQPPAVWVAALCVVLLATFVVVGALLGWLLVGPVLSWLLRTAGYL